MKDKDLDFLVRKAFESGEKPDARLIGRVENLWIKEEEESMNRTARLSIRTFAVVVGILAVLAGSALAALNILKPVEVAKKMGNARLSAAFESDDSVSIDETVTSGDYTITLLGLTSGKNIDGFEVTGDNVQPDRSYAVISICRTDGKPMTEETDGGLTGFYVSPLVKGLKPWMVNINTLSGSVAELMYEGAAYRIIDCNDITVFADRGLYLCVSDTVTFSREAFSYDEKTGEIAPNAEYQGINALFELPVDASLANSEKAGEYLSKIGYDDSAISEDESPVEDSPTFILDENG